MEKNIFITIFNFYFIFLGGKMITIKKENNTKLLKFRKDMNESITLIMCCNDNYNAKTINYEIMVENWNDNHEIISFFNIDIDNGFENKVRPLYKDDEEVIIEVITYYFEED